MPNLHTPPPRKHSLPARNIRIFHFTGTQPLALRSFGRAAAHCLKALPVRSIVPNPIPFPSERLAERQSRLSPPLKRRRSCAVLPSPSNALLAKARFPLTPSRTAFVNVGDFSFQNWRFL